MKYWIGGIVIVVLAVSSYWATSSRQNKNIEKTTAPNVSQIVNQNSPTKTVSPSSVVVGNMPGNMAPDFRLVDLAGSDVSLKDYLGKTKIKLVFWTSSCRVCVDNIKSSDSLVLAINRGEKKEIVNDYKNLNSEKVKILLNPADTIYRLYNGGAMPFNIIIDEHGIIR